MFSAGAGTLEVFGEAFVVVALVVAWAVSRATAGRVGWPLAAAAVLCYPGLLYTLALGQNAVITLALWSLGWMALVRGRDFTAGLCWGLLVYKVHWVVAVGWLPVYLVRPRALCVRHARQLMRRHWRTSLGAPRSRPGPSATRSSRRGR